MNRINHFAVIRKALPDEILNWNWQDIPLYPYENLPSVPCVLVVYKKDFDNLAPLQIGMTSNLKNYINSDLDAQARNGTNIFYVTEQSEIARKLMRQQLRSFFYDEK
ncbi:hypothetical protein Elgi_38200 [Paenibacillus elgii]|uniref:hypothetical protein n=1 Tax=Paenibacillus elgii TaxID=189691 RepID=UPI002D7C5EEF|nr:hypothetical protein Elgi_38200 [Paenibacillus elgii]